MQVTPQRRTPVILVLSINRSTKDNTTTTYSLKIVIMTSNEQLMAFMTDFRKSIEDSIKTTNEKLDDKLEVMNAEIAGINDKIEKNDDVTNRAIGRMDKRLQELELEMKSSNARSVERQKLQDKVNETNAPKSTESGMNTLNANIGRQDVGQDKTEESRRARKTFHRSNISQRDLRNDSTKDATKEVEINPVPYRSVWAKEMEQQLEEAARHMDAHPERTDGRSHQEEFQEGDSPWSRVGFRDKAPKVRKPVEVRDWFADEKSDSNSESSSDSNDDDEQWSEVKRKEVKNLKAKARKQKKKERMESMAERMRHMIGVGPIPKASIDFFTDADNDKDEATKKAIKEYLKYYLDFNEDELSSIEILDTKKAAKDDTYYFAVKNEDHIREIHVRRAASGNDDLTVRDYIPPSFHARYMAVARQATQKRTEDKSLKTQLRWGHKDIKIFVKIKGESEPYKKTSLTDFMDGTVLPKIDDSVRWRQRKDSKISRKPDFRKDCPVLPSLAAAMEPTSLTRKHSTSSRDDAAKRPRKNLSKSNLDTEMEDPLAIQDIEHDDE